MNVVSRLPLIPSPWVAVARTVPAWVYIGAGASVVALAALAWATHQGAAHQAQRDAPVIAQAKGEATYQAGAASLTWKQLDNSNTRAASEARTRESTDGHVQRLQTAADDRAAFSEFLSGLHDGESPPSSAKGAPVPGRPGAPHEADPPH